MDKNEYIELSKTIRYHMDRYYNQDAPEISHYEYDQMMQELKKPLQHYMKHLRKKDMMYSKKWIKQ